MNSIFKYCANLILFFSLVISHSKCNINQENSPESNKLLLIKIIKLQFTEPSGLALAYDQKHLWSVSDNDRTVYFLDMNGKIVKSFKVDGEDLEGIAVIDDLKIAVILERNREVVILDTSGKELNRAKLDLKGKLNKGIEGICFNTSKNQFYFVNEKEPGLFFNTDTNFNIISKKEITFAKDYSDICYVAEDSSLWILSDESQKVFRVDINGKVIKEYKINVKQPEGLAVDYKQKKLFIVSDKTGKLYEYSLP